MSILSEFCRAIELQQKIEDDAFDAEMELAVSERVVKGITIDNLKVEFLFYEGTPNRFCPLPTHPAKYISQAIIHCENNISKFRVGGSVTLSNGTKKYQLDVIEDSVENFILAPNDFEIRHCTIDPKNYKKDGWQINVAKKSITLKLLKATAMSLESDTNRLAIIERLLTGKLVNKRNATLNYATLNDAQNSAVKRAFENEYFHLIQGPPGTGKTITIAHIAKLLAESGKKVFITAPTHTAINNCLNAVSNLICDRSKVVKIGEKHQAEELLNNPHVTRKTRLPYETYLNCSELKKDGIIIGGTPYSLCYPASKKLNEWSFDVALIDEAAQMSIPLAVAVMAKCNKFIFVGDHMQLDPIMPSGTDSTMFSESVFSRLSRLYPQESSLLNVSYRLNEQLIRIPNILFYSNKLKSHASLKADKTIIGSNSYFDLFNKGDSKVLFLHHEFDAQGRSPFEAETVALLVKDLLNNGVNQNDIGILTPYRAQVREIKKMLSKKLKHIDIESKDSIFVDTVDRMQGQERDYVIYSLGYSHPLESKRNLDFFYSPNRLNVAITRALKKCIVIANYKVFDLCDENTRDIPDLVKLRPYFEVFRNYFMLSTKIETNAKEDEW